jgi:CrcB protein
MVGTPARYALERIIHVAPGTFPWSTFTVNVTGCFALGVLLTLIVERWPPSRYVRAFAVIGFLGAYTTFSTYTVEAITLTKDHHAGVAAAYVAASIVAGLGAVYAGILLARLPVLRGRAG